MKTLYPNHVTFNVLGLGPGISSGATTGPTLPAGVGPYKQVHASPALRVEDAPSFLPFPQHPQQWRPASTPQKPLPKAPSLFSHLRAPHGHARHCTSCPQLLLAGLPSSAGSEPPLHRTSSLKAQKYTRRQNQTRKGAGCRDSGAEVCSRRRHGQSIASTGHERSWEHRGRPDQGPLARSARGLDWMRF